MRKVRWMVAALAVCVGILAGRAAVALAEPAGEDAGRIVVFRFDGGLQEAPPAVEFGFEMGPRHSLYGLLERFRKAKKDERVKAVVVTFDRPEIGWAQMQEIRQEISDLRAADKDVYCYLEEASGRVYQLATAASRICLVPTGEVRLVGFQVEQVYFKGLLDKIGVQADVEQIGAYKEAGEPFTQTAPSEKAREMVKWLADDLFDQMVETIAEGRQIPNNEVRALIDRGPFTAREALEANLVDETLYAEAFAESLRERYGQAVEFVHDYGAKRGPEIDFSSPLAFFKLLGEAVSKVKEPTKPSIAVVYVDSVIMTGKTECGWFGERGPTGSTTIRRVLTRVRKDDGVKAVVLRVDSPGGSAVASDIIWHATRAVGGEKPLVVSMGNVAASGGYYVSAGARAIFADPGTVTGSIGVLGGKLVTKGLWDWLGVTFHETTRGRNADLLNSNRPFDDRQRALIRKHMQAVYDTFTDRVAKGREGRLKKDLEQLAGGRVFTGRQAQANGLVDKLGGLQAAIKFAAAEANVSDYKIRLLPEPRNFMDLLMRGLSGKEEDEEGADVEVAAKAWHWTLKTPAVRQLLPALQKIDPHRAGVILRSLLRIELLGREHTLLVLPGEITIR